MPAKKQKTETAAVPTVDTEEEKNSLEKEAGQSAGQSGKGTDESNLKVSKSLRKVASPEDAEAIFDIFRDHNKYVCPFCEEYYKTTSLTVSDRQLRFVCGRSTGHPKTETGKGHKKGYCDVTEEYFRITNQKWKPLPKRT